MLNITEKIKLLGIVPVVKIDDENKAVPLAEALCRGGLPCAEITFRTNAAEESIRRVADALPDMLVGAGTVLTPAQADKAKAAGAKFIVSPGLNPNVVEHCKNINMPIFPGCSSPSDIEKALELGLTCVKFFPAEQAGGIAAIKAMSAPYGNISFMPTGGVNAKNLNDYLSFDKVIACGGSWMVDAALINSGDFSAIEELTRSAVFTMLGFAYKPGGNPEFGGYIEMTGETIAIRANYLDRAVYFLKSIGIKFKENSAVYNAKGKMTAIYLENKTGGFDVRFVQG